MRYDPGMYTERQQKEIADFVASLPTMSEDELTVATRKFIWLSAYETWEVTAPEIGPEGGHDSFVACSSECVALVMQAKVSA